MSAVAIETWVTKPILAAAAIGRTVDSSAPVVECPLGVKSTARALSLMAVRHLADQGQAASGPLGAHGKITPNPATRGRASAWH